MTFPTKPRIDSNVHYQGTAYEEHTDQHSIAPGGEPSAYSKPPSANIEKGFASTESIGNVYSSERTESNFVWNIARRTDS